MGLMLRVASWMFVYWCVASVLALGAGAAYMWTSGKINNEKMFKILAVIHDVSLESEDDAQQQAMTPEGPLPSYQQIEKAREIAERQLEIRMVALQNNINASQARSAAFQENFAQFQALAASFDVRLLELSDEAHTEGFTKLRQIWTVSSPEFVKNHIMEMVQAGQLEEVVAIFSEMVVDNKMAKICSVFVSEDEKRVLFNVLDMILQGKPHTELIDSTLELMDSLQPAELPQ